MGCSEYRTPEGSKITCKHVKLVSDSARVPTIAGFLAGIGLLVSIGAMMSQSIPASLFPIQPASISPVDQTDPTYKGLVFDNVVNLTNSTAMFIPNIPALAISGKNVYVAWKEGPIDPGPEILFRASHDSGNTFSDPIRVGDRAGLSFPPQVAASTKFVYVVWVGTVPVNNTCTFQTFLRASSDYGATFGNTINLSSSSGEAVEPQIAADGENVYIVWQDSTPGKNDIFLRASFDNATTFGRTVNISDNSQHSNSPSLTIFEGKLFIMWSDQSYGNSDILVARIIPHEPFTGDIINISNDRQVSTNPKLALTEKYAYFVWESHQVLRETEYIPIREIMFRASNDNGVSFDAALRISNNIRDSMQPNIAARGQNVYVVWTGSNPDGFQNVVFRKSIDAGELFDRTVNLQNDLTHHMSPKIIAESNAVYITWDNAATSSNQSFVLVYDNGTRLVNNVAFETEPMGIMDSSLAITNDDVYLAWDNWDQEIYFASAER